MQIIHRGQFPVTSILAWTSLINMFPRWLGGKESACRWRNHRRHNSISGLGRPPGEGNGNPLQYSCLGNPMDRGARRAAVRGLQRIEHI